jgi:hypothetical protein
MAGFSNCKQPAAPASDDGCETNTESDVTHCGSCTTVCPQPLNACQKRTCIGACTFVSTGSQGCCSNASDCQPTNACQTPICSANQCGNIGKVDVDGCCNSNDDCPSTDNPCMPNDCVDNNCQIVSIPNCVPDFSVEPLPDLTTDDTLSGYSFSGGGGCQATGDASGIGLVLALLWMRKKRR